MSKSAPAPLAAPSVTTKEARRWLIFALVGIAQFMVVLDTAIINVALPVMKSYLGVSDTSVQWLVTAYVLAFGGFLLLGGRAADLFGRRRVLIAGMIGFTTCSGLIAVSSTLPELIVFRGLQGASAAMMAPSALSIVIVTFPDVRDRGKALGYWSMIATGGGATGLILGGVLTQFAGWRWNFLINVPVGLAVSVLVTRLVPPHHAEHRFRSLDLPGAALVTAGLMSAVLGCSQAPIWGWESWRTLVSLVGASLLLTAFVVSELRATQPLIDLGVLKIQSVTAANAIMACVFGGNLGMFFVLTLWMQGIQGWDAIQTGLAFVPFPVVLGVVSTQMGHLVYRFGARRFLVLGPSIVVAGMVWLCFLPVQGSYVRSVLPALLVMAVGYGMTFAPIYAAATGGLEPRQAGTASGMIATSQQVGGALGLGALSGVAATVTAAQHGGHASALNTGYNAGMAVAAAMTLCAPIAALAVRRRPAE